MFYLSDTHFEWQADGGTSFLTSLKTGGTLVLAGDIGLCGKTLPQMADLFENVVFVLGNHDYYGSSLEKVHDEVSKVVSRHPNLHWLNDSDVVVGGQHFVGGVLWFQNNDNLNVLYEKGLSDFSRITNFRKWVYSANSATRKYLLSAITPNSIVVTHHAPSMKSVSPKFAGSSLNRFFVSSEENLINRTRPLVWIHGHMHDSVEYMIGDTMVCCNPHGYPFECPADFAPREIKVGGK